jgi:hypothetical protein
MTLVASSGALQSLAAQADTPRIDEEPLRLTITLYPPQDRGATCHACGAECAVRYGLPVDGELGEYVENDFVGEWAGVPACKPCYDAHAEGGVAGLRIRLRALEEIAGEIRRDTKRALKKSRGVR